MTRIAIFIFGVSLAALFSFRQEKKKVLIIGDSISIGYFAFVKEAMKNSTDIIHNPGNAEHTGTGLKLLDKWLGDTHWDVIHFNWGLWDLCYRSPQSKEQGNRDKANGALTFTVEQYAVNLDSLVVRLKETGAKLIFATTTVVPPKEAGRFEGDEKKYNKAALKIMKKYGVAIDDLNRFSYSIHKKYAIAEGNVHYTEAGYKQLAQPVIKTIRNALE